MEDCKAKEMIHEKLVALARTITKREEDQKRAEGKTYSFPVIGVIATIVFGFVGVLV